MPDERQLLLDDRPPWGVHREVQDEKAERRKYGYENERCPRCTGPVAMGEGAKVCPVCGWTKITHAGTPRAAHRRRRR